ncbi:MAG: hypothetical protein IKE38_02195, partial [Erysipelotrichaceae bacterium]|nr:hypothetical protein [Erysipelotrichaceae bacterium]
NCAHIEFYYVTDSEQELMLPQTYYKGYQVFLTDGEWIKLDTYDLPYYHQVTFKTVPGAHHYTCIYKGTLIQKAGVAISGSSLLSLLLIIYRRNKTRR